MTTLIDVKEVQEQARKEICEEATKKAKDKLKTLYQTREKAVLALKNIDREIETYLNEITETFVYESAGVDTK